MHCTKAVNIFQVSLVQMRQYLPRIVLLGPTLWAMLLAVWIVQVAISVQSLTVYLKFVLQATILLPKVCYVYHVVKAMLVLGMVPVSV